MTIIIPPKWWSQIVTNKGDAHTNAVLILALLVKLQVDVPLNRLFVSNKYIKDYFNLKTQQVSYALNVLKNAGFLTKENVTHSHVEHDGTTTKTIHTRAIHIHLNEEETYSIIEQYQRLAYIQEVKCGRRK